MSDGKAGMFGAPKWLDNVAAFVLCTITMMFAIITIGPYFGLHPTTDDANQKAVVNNLMIAITSFMIGGSVASRKKDDAIQTLATTAQTAQSALAPLADAKPAVTLPPGDSLTVKAAEETKETP